MFVSIDEVTAIVKEELNSYFASGAVDDVLFPKWVKFALKDFRKTALPIATTSLPIDNYTCELPENFDSVKEVWSCGIIGNIEIPNFSAFYYQTDCRITPIDDPCNVCYGQACRCSGPTKQEKYRVTHKVTNRTFYEYEYKTLLKPADPTTRSCCNEKSLNRKSKSYDTFTIRDCKIITNFQTGYLHLCYYGKAEDENGNPLIEDNDFIKDYLIKHLKYKVFESLYNSVNDESTNQLERKMRLYNELQIEAKVSAMDDQKKLTKQQVANMIDQRKQRFSYYRRSLS